MAHAAGPPVSHLLPMIQCGNHISAADIRRAFTILVWHRTEANRYAAMLETLIADMEE